VGAGCVKKKRKQAGCFGSCLVNIRNSRNLSQKALAILAGMDQSYLAGLETGRRAPPKEKQIIRLIEALHASPEEAQELRDAHTFTKLLDVAMAPCPERNQVLAALSGHLLHLSVEEIKEIEILASKMNRLGSNTNHRKELMT